MKTNWNHEDIENWIRSTVEQPSSNFQRKSDAWLRQLRSQPSKRPSQLLYARILGWLSIPLVIAVALALMFMNQSDMRSIPGLPDPLEARELAAFQELVQMDELLEPGMVMLDQDQLEILQILSTIPNLGDTFAMANVTNNS